MTCRKPAPAATAALFAVALASGVFGAAAPARAGLFGAAKPKPPAKAAAAAPSPPLGAAQRDAADRLEPLARAAFWARAVDENPTDADAGVRFAAALRTLGRFDEAAQAADKVLVLKPADEPALLEAARSRIGAKQSFYAIPFLERAQAAAPRDWRPFSLLGVAYAETKQPALAQQAWSQALTISPENPAVLSNMAMALAAQGQAAQAEALLRRACASPSAGVQERQNLALVLGLEGKVGEAEGLIRRDLPPELADRNVAYLQAANRR
ncbi:MAG: tetratricopeptide repeat protein [Caulobacteraceae bacterium]|nr:tetratricopeptide repeat protein [Caulobacter sp.]